MSEFKGAPELLEALELAHKELHACQAVIHYAGGFDPAIAKAKGQPT